MKKPKNSIIWKLITQQKQHSLVIFTVSFVSTLLNSLGLTLVVPVLFKVFNLSTSTTGETKIESFISKFLPWFNEKGPLYLLALVIVVFLVKNTLIALRVHLVASLSNKHLLYFRTSLLRHYLRKDLYFYFKEGSGKLLNQLLMNAEKSSKVVSDIVESIGMSVQLLAYAIVLSFISWQLFLVAFVFGFPLLILMKYMGQKVKKLSVDRAHRYSALSQSINDTIKGIRFIKLAHRENDHIGWVEAQSAVLQQQLTRITFLSNIGQPLTEVSAVLILIGFIAVIHATGSTNAISIDTFFSFLLILSRALLLFNVVTNRIMDIAGAYGSLDQVESALKDTSWMSVSHGSKPLKRIKEGIIFDKVYFNYPESDISVLNEISFEVKQGESVAIVGPSGSGKSTITDLLLRFYKPTQGKIIMNGMDISTIDLSEYRRRVGLVPQESVMFFSTLRENLCYFHPNASELEIWRALEQADLAEFVNKLPKGLDTQIGEGGVSLSGGQRQRLSIARTLLMSPDVLIFDEATSSLDSVSEARIVDSIKRVSQGRTTITIAHRLATILHCDKVFLVEHGWLIESGSIPELLASSSRFKKYAEAQNLKLVA